MREKQQIAIEDKFAVKGRKYKRTRMDRSETIDQLIIEA